MATKRAKVIDELQLQAALERCRTALHPDRDRLKILLSCAAGLRAAEIAALAIEHVLGSDGVVGSTLWIPAEVAAKNKRERFVPMHPDLRKALMAHLRTERRTSGPLIVNDHGKAYLPNTMVQWFRRFYAGLGWYGCTSHTGRRSFITKAARAANRAHCSLVDVQRMAGHSRLTSTEVYIEETPERTKLVSMLW